MLAAAHHGVYHMNYWQAVVIGVIQGVFELFPLSSLGHTVLIPSWIGGNWALLVRQESQTDSPYLAFVVGLHLANAAALILFYLREWGRLVGGFFTSIARRRITTDSERLAWLIVIATIPVGLLGLLLEHTFRTLFAKPLAAGAFLAVNGGILMLGEHFVRQRRRAHPEQAAQEEKEEADRQLVTIDDAAQAQLASIGARSAFAIGASQSLALFAGISREGVAMVGGLTRGLSRENALRFAFLLSAPVIFAAGALKVPDLLGTLGNGIRGEVVVGSIVTVATSLVAIALAARYFRTRSLVPFAVYSVLFGVASVVRFGLF
ncbi:MAG TPA: undecaprenyl-diphosphate phosphatase [Acidimicrobiales bacterium]|nr:undecaprenyl-diphosphate phosphatase [Acidimicrobiales bacterium]